MRFVQSAPLRLFLIYITLTTTSLYALKEGECEVCQKVLTRFTDQLTDEDLADTKIIEEKFRTFCKPLKSKEYDFCYYLGGLPESSTGILPSISAPISYRKPVEKVCEALKKKDSQICELKYDVPINIENVNLKTLRVKELKKIINSWGEECLGCAEKQDFIDRIVELKPKRSDL